MSHTEAVATDTGNSERVRAKVTRTFPEKGYVWVQSDSGESYFVHASKIRDAVDIFEIWVGQWCSLIPRDGERGPFGEDVEMEKR